MLYCAWRYGGHNPYVLYNGEGAPPPPHPVRVTTFILGCAGVAYEEDVKLAGGKIRTRRGL